MRRSGVRIPSAPPGSPVPPKPQVARDLRFRRLRRSPVCRSGPPQVDASVVKQCPMRPRTLRWPPTPPRCRSTSSPRCSPAPSASSGCTSSTRCRPPTSSRSSPAQRRHLSSSLPPRAGPTTSSRPRSSVTESPGFAPSRLGVGLAIAEHLAREIGVRFEPPAILRDKVAAGDLGRKTGRGFYRWRARVLPLVSERDATSR